MTPEAVKAVREALRPIAEMGEFFVAAGERGEKRILYQSRAGAITVGDCVQAADAAALLAAEQAKAPPDQPCNWVGGNDYAACTVCGIEYDYRKTERPPCPKAPPDRERAAGALAIYADGVEALEKRVKGEEWLKALAIALREAAAALRSYAAEIAAERDRLAKEVERLRSEMTIIRDMLHEPDLDGDVPAFDQRLIRLIDRALSSPTPEGGGG